VAEIVVVPADRVYDVAGHGHGSDVDADVAVRARQDPSGLEGGGVGVMAGVLTAGDAGAAAVLSSVLSDWRCWGRGSRSRSWDSRRAHRDGLYCMHGRRAARNQAVAGALTPKDRQGRNASDLAEVGEDS